MEAALGRRDHCKGGRPAFYPVLKFRMYALHVQHGLSLNGPNICCTTA